MPDSKAARLPSDVPLFGCFAQGRAEPEIVTLFRDWTRLTTNDHGEMNGRSLEGFFAAETQLVTMYRTWVNGRSLQHRYSVQMSPTQWSSLGVLSDTVETGDPPEGNIPQGSVEVRFLRAIDSGWIERIWVANNGPTRREVSLLIKLACPIGDMEIQEEMKREEKVAVEGVVPRLIWEHGKAHLCFERHFGARSHTPTQELRRILGRHAPRDDEPVKRGVHLTVSSDRDLGLKVVAEKVTQISSSFYLEPKSEVSLTLVFEPEIDGVIMKTPDDGVIQPLPLEAPSVQGDLPRIHTSNSTLNLMLAQALVDLDSLRLPVYLVDEVGGGPQRPRQEGFIFNAGIPRYMGVFSRDNLTTAWQAALLVPEHLEPVITRIASYRGVRDDPWRDEEPRKIPHERRLNPNAALGISNRELYYGDVTSTSFWIVALATAWHWLGNPGLLRRMHEPYRDCLRWIRTSLAQGGGFIYYRPKMPQVVGSNRNHAWKDSGDAIVDSRGRIRVPPLALSEIQGYAYQALLCAAEFELIHRNVDAAKTLYAEAQALKKRFNEKFWLEDRRFYALALDGNGEPVDSIASNIGHCLGTGLIDESRVEDVVRCLLSGDMFSGWGIRTLSYDNPAFDPFAYHRGAVWPVENAIIANGLSLCGHSEDAETVVSAQFGLASLFQHMRLPELISGHHRCPEIPTPGLYPFANLLQAWSVSAVSMNMQTLLGIRPDAPRGRVYLDPHLPDWLPWVEITNLRVGDSHLDLGFSRRSSGKSDFEVLRSEGEIEVMSGNPGWNPELAALRGAFGEKAAS